MSLVPKQTKQATPAAKLALLYGGACSRKGISNTNDFRKLLTKHKYEEIVKVIDWLRTQPEGIRCKPSSWFCYRFRWLVLQSKEALAGYPIADPGEIRGYRLAIADRAEPIPDEYIQHCIDHYNAFLSWMRGYPEGIEIWARMPPASEFVLTWFIHLVPKYSNQYRKFSVSHAQFLKFLIRVAKDCSTSAAAEKLVRLYGTEATA